jgi:hypothetical protein
MLTMEFSMVHTIINGKVSDGDVLHETRFYEKLTDGSLKLPAPESSDGTHQNRTHCASVNPSAARRGYFHPWSSCRKEL